MPTTFRIVAAVTLRVKPPAGSSEIDVGPRILGRNCAIRPTFRRNPFQGTQVLTQGAIAVGYDESDMAKGRAQRRTPKIKTERLWRLCRQELYLNDETAPFATINWRFILDAIEIASAECR